MAQGLRMTQVKEPHEKNVELLNIDFERHNSEEIR